MFKMISAVLLIAPLLTTLPALAREGRGQHETKVVCAVVKDLKTATACFKEVAGQMPSENDANAVLVSNKATAKALLVEIVTLQEKTDSVAVVEAADYVAAVVQNDDEESIYYYTLTNGVNVAPVKAGFVISFVDFSYDVCPMSEDEPADWPAKFRSIKTLLLGMDKPAAGKLWLDDVSCDE